MSESRTPTGVLREEHQLILEVLGIQWPDGGLNRFDPATEMFKRYVHNPQDSKSLSNDILVSITEDKNGILWIGTWGGGLIRFDLTTENFSTYVHDSQNTSSISGDYVTAVHQARDSKYWVMTRFNGLNLFDPSTQTFKHFPLPEKNESKSRNIYLRKGYITSYLRMHQ